MRSQSNLTQKTTEVDGVGEDYAAVSGCTGWTMPGIFSKLQARFHVNTRSLVVMYEHANQSMIQQQDDCKTYIQVIDSVSSINCIFAIVLACRSAYKQV